MSLSAVQRRCRRDQSRPSISAASCEAESRITPSLIGGQQNALCSRRFHSSTSPDPSQAKFSSGPLASNGSQKSFPRTDHGGVARAPARRDRRHYYGSPPASSRP